MRTYRSLGSNVEVCHKDTGACLCQSNFAGQTCEHCATGFFNHPSCEPCACDPMGVIYDGSSTFSCLSRSVIDLSLACDQRGQCHCKPNFGGRQCNQCAPGKARFVCRSFIDHRCVSAGYFRYPDCIPCSCDMHGSLGLSCEQLTGQCICKGNFVGEKCQECAPGTTNDLLSCSFQRCVLSRSRLKRTVQFSVLRGMQMCASRCTQRFSWLWPTQHSRCPLSVQAECRRTSVRSLQGRILEHESEQSARL